MSGGIHIRIIGLDLATTVGYHIEAGEINFGGIKTLRKNKLEFYRWLVEICTENEIEVIAYEDIQFRVATNGTRPTEIYGFLKEVVKGVGMEHNIVTKGLNLSNIRKTAFGKGRLPKDEIIKRLKIEGYRPVDHNHADAIAVLIACRGRINLGLY